MIQTLNLLFFLINTIVCAVYPEKFNYVTWTLLLLATIYQLVVMLLWGELTLHDIKLSGEF